MLAHILTTAGLKAVACGNVGTTVIDSVLSPEKYDYLVLELSSFQLHLQVPTKALLVATAAAAGSDRTEQSVGRWAGGGGG